MKDKKPSKKPAQLWLDEKPEVLQPEVIEGDASHGPSEAGWHSIESFLRCPKSYQFQHVRGLKKPQHKELDHFAIGIMFHAARARWFAKRFDTSEGTWDSIQEAVRKAALENKLPVSLEAEQRTLAMMRMYMDFYVKRPRPQPIACEYKLGPVPMQPNDPFFLYRTARLDDVSKYPEAAGQLCLGESKTTSTSINDAVQQYELHGQTMLQLVLWRMDPNGEAKYGKVAGIMLDVVKKPYGNDKAAFGRTFLPITDWQLDWFVRNMQGYLRAAANIEWDTDAPRNVSACTYLAGRARVDCTYKDLCRFGKSASVKYVMRDGKSLLTFKPGPGRTVPPWE